MGNKRIVIVILNYMKFDETEECVNSIMQQKYDNYHVLIVDNGSSNGSYVTLKRKYTTNKKISVIRANKNYGFAKGNNIGIQYAKNKLGAEYVMLLNSDTILCDPLYIQQMIDADEPEVGVIGSCIRQRDGRRVRKIARYVTFPATLFYYLQLLAEIKNNILWKPILEKKTSQYDKVYILQGCVLLLTPSYFKYYSDLDARTFLYCEEELLYIRCQRVGLKEKILDNLFLYHKCGMSSDEVADSKRRILFDSYQYVLRESLKIYLLSKRKR